ncbi:thiamine pyrophosphate-dependent enzyme [Neptunomonas sp.]|uniref:dehydrogenase E1 component subunit alpha/beta n=1 Tax=Neptunomonas sp. TaxID=1971898 RepID=UPI0025D69B70|nr:thiamine pyrophosphate-dependent enzyme [Neptunomonas sp.]
MQNRAKVVDENFTRRVLEGDLPASHLPVTLTDVGMQPTELVELFESQLMSRHLDLQSRLLQARGEAFYTIGSSGHEGNAAIGKAFDYRDMAFLHYRDAAFLIQRSKQLPGETILQDMLLSFAASADDPVSGGRHKVLGSKRLYIPPQTSTIASHLPKAVGAAYSIPLAKRMKLDAELPYDGVVLCSFGDASANHSTAQGAFNTAAWTAYQDVPMPLVFVCEDNGIGISTTTPDGWIAANFAHRPGLKYIFCDGLNLLDTYQKAREAASYARHHRKPVFLHMRTVRLMGHAGSDAQTAYMANNAIEAAESQDPLLHTARLLIENNVLSTLQVCDLYEVMRERTARVAEQVITRPKLSTSTQVIEALIPPKKPYPVFESVTSEARQAIFAREQRLLSEPQHMARLINWTLADLMLEQSNIILAGEDIGPKGGVYNVTGKLSERFGKHRVINTLLDEQSILGLAIGLAHNGFLPIPEIQFLAYVHNAEDQIRGEAATLSFFSNGQFTNPMVIRVAGLAYQKGFGGHFHNDNSLAVFRDIPGLVIACPSNGADAVEMLRACVKLAQEEQRVVVFIEPIALYMTRDLHTEGDGLWTNNYLPPEQAKSTLIQPGEFGQHGEGTELCILTYGNGYYLSRQAAKVLEDEYGIALRIIDLRWLAPLNEDKLAEAIAPCQHLLIVDECRSTGSISEALVTMVHEQLQNKEQAQALKMKRLTAEDSFIPLGRAATSTLPRKETILAAALDLLGESLRNNEQPSTVINVKTA